MKSDIRAELVKEYHVSCLLLALQHHPSLKPEDFHQCKLIRHGWFPVQHMTLDQTWAWLFNGFSSQWCLSETTGIKDPKLSFALFFYGETKSSLTKRYHPTNVSVCVQASFRTRGDERVLQGFHCGLWKWWCVFIDQEVQHKKLWQRLLWTLYVFLNTQFYFVCWKLERRFPPRLTDGLTTAQRKSDPQPGCTKYLIYCLHLVKEPTAGRLDILFLTLFLLLILLAVFKGRHQKQLGWY